MDPEEDAPPASDARSTLTVKFQNEYHAIPEWKISFLVFGFVLLVPGIVMLCIGASVRYSSDGPATMLRIGLILACFGTMPFFIMGDVTRVLMKNMLIELTVCTSVVWVSITYIMAGTGMITLITDLILIVVLSDISRTNMHYRGITIAIMVLSGTSVIFLTMGSNVIYRICCRSPPPDATPTRLEVLTLRTAPFLIYVTRSPSSLATIATRTTACNACRRSFITDDERFDLGCGCACHLACLDAALKKSPHCPNCNKSAATISFH